MIKCKICEKEITSKEDIHWLDDLLVCEACFEHEKEESRD